MKDTYTIVTFQMYKNQWKYRGFDENSASLMTLYYLEVGEKVYFVNSK